MNIPEVSNWDNWLQVETDYNLNDFSEVTEIVKKMPKLDLITKNYSQYKEERYYTWCTGMRWINAMATINNYDFTWQEISEIYDVYENMWWKPWNPWARWAWLNAVKNWWNNKFPNNKMMYFLEDIFSESSEIVFSKLGIVWVSLRVDSKYWQDVRRDLEVGWDNYLKSIWHATTCMLTDNYICVDSVPRISAKKDIPMTYTYGNLDRIKELVKAWNFRSDIHIIIMEKRLTDKELSQEERLRLITFKAKLEIVIQCNSDMWTLTTQEADKKRLHNENVYNRWKLRVINGLLWVESA